MAAAAAEKRRNIRTAETLRGSIMTRNPRNTVLSEIDPFTKDDELRVVIETPRGSRNKSVGSLIE